MADSLEVSTLLGGILVAVSCLKSLLAITRSVNQFVAFSFYPQRSNVNVSSFSNRVQMYPEQCEQAKRIDIKTDKNEYGAM